MYSCTTMTLDDAGASSRYYHSHATNSLQLDPLSAQNAAPYANNKSPAIPITPISPVIASAAGDKSILDLGSPSKSHPAGNLPIPPPPNPRRHRSGVLMSRVRANSSGTNFQTGNAIGSKSFGDLNMSMSTMSTGNDEEELEYEEGPVPPWAKRPSKRVVSEGFGRGSDEEDGMWDNRSVTRSGQELRPVRDSTIICTLDPFPERLQGRLRLRNHHRLSLGQNHGRIPHRRLQSMSGGLSPCRKTGRDHHLTRLLHFRQTTCFYNNIFHQHFRAKPSLPRMFTHLTLTW